jgi:hypothetical protein
MPFMVVKKEYFAHDAHHLIFKIEMQFQKLHSFHFSGESVGRHLLSCVKQKELFSSAEPNIILFSLNLRQCTKFRNQLILCTALIFFIYLTEIFHIRFWVCRILILMYTNCDCPPYTIPKLNCLLIKGNMSNVQSLVMLRFPTY